jgi:hypothetical protein
MIHTDQGADGQAVDVQVRRPAAALFTGDEGVYTAPKSNACQCEETISNLILYSMRVCMQIAAFLIAAQKWSYVGVGNGWNGPSSFPLVDILKKPLGAPKGDAVVIDAKAGVFTREFEHLSLKLNVSAWSAEFTWS